MQKYPLGCFLGSGIQAKVYSSGQKFAVKVFNDMSGFIRELYWGGILQHDCILKAIAWTFDQVGYIVMPLGKDVQKAYIEKVISIEEIVSDTLSVVNYMKSVGVVHNDIKLANMIYHEGKIKMIDLGLSTVYIKSKMSWEIYSLVRSYYELPVEDIKIPPLDWFVDKIRFGQDVSSMMIEALKPLIVRTY